jgi:hypothetical protein
MKGGGKKVEGERKAAVLSTSSMKQIKTKMLFEAPCGKGSCKYAAF